MPQFYIMLFLYFSSPSCFGISNGITLSNIYFYFKLLLSFFSYCLGQEKFLDIGPLANPFNVRFKSQHWTLRPIQFLKQFLSVFLPPILEAYFIAMNGGFNLGCSKFQTFFIIFGMCFFPNVLFSLGAMFASMGIVTTLKVIIRYPSIVAVAFRTGFVYAPHSYETVCNITSKGDTLQHHGSLSVLNWILMTLVLLLVSVIMVNHTTFFSGKMEQTESPSPFMFV